MQREFVTLGQALETPGIVDALSYAFDFALLAEPRKPEGFAVVDCKCRVIAVDATGGAYAECDHLRVLRFVYVDPRGRAGGLSNTFAELLRLVIELPYFREVLFCSGGGDLGEMRLAARLLEEDVRDDLPFFEAARQDILATFAMPEMDDPVAHLHFHAVRSSADLVVLAADGSRYDPLAGRRSVRDNPEWSSRVQPGL